MFKRYLKINSLVFVLFVAALFLLGPVLKVNAELLISLNQWFTNNKATLLVYHAFVFLALFLLWPKLVQKRVKSLSEVVSPEQLKHANNLRYWLVAVLILVDLFFVLGG